jgi:hypothetical protein
VTGEEFERVQRAMAEMRAAIEQALPAAPDARYKALALTDLERSYLWIVAAVGTATELERRTKAGA